MSKKLAIILSVILGPIFIDIAVAGYILYFASNWEYQDRQWFLIVAVASTAVIVLALLFFIGRRIQWRRLKTVQQIKQLSIPHRQIEDYKLELNRVRSNFHGDMHRKKNRIPVFVSIAGMEEYFNFSAIDNGEIYYGCLVQANNRLFKPYNGVLPAVILYSKDKYYEANPLALQKLAKEMYNDKPNNFLQNEYRYFLNYKLTSYFIGSKDVYITTMMIYARHLPLSCLCAPIFPIITCEEFSACSFVVDSKYWTENLVSNFIYNDYAKTADNSAKTE